MAKGLFYDKKTKKFIHVAKGPGGNFSFYRTRDLHKPGARIKGLYKYNFERWFNTKADAEKALPKFAEKKGFVFLNYDEILQLERSQYISTSEPPAYWLR